MAELESFVGCPLASIVSSVGGEKTGNNALVDASLDLLEALWATQALKERHFDAWMAELHQLHSKEVYYYFYFVIIFQLICCWWCTNLTCPIGGGSSANIIAEN